MKILVAVASKHGATMEIGEAIGRALRESGNDVAVLAATKKAPAGGYDAVILGSGVYAGHWLDGATEFEKTNHAYLAKVPVWMFSSGPVGEPPLPADHAVAVDSLIERVQPVEHRLFAGKLDRRKLGFGERALTAALRVPEGDFRDWAAIEEWAQGIGAVLASGWGSARAS